ncbi:beta-ketoacyl synthase N-terminal-like domain-containing protein [Nocardia altamirensis]|uniref:beta-ketoacyl synthase N-terminal-like domain-containing protein n=1 Tax=Nocardia altamirensis TaxID=472158 RepID=UPI0008400CFE|nr:beta-ketoacyl synthase N-terminal-like domain-containing protein [Nocardia altamirensis]
MHATVVDYLGAHRAAGYETASAFDPGPHLADAQTARLSRAEVLAHCVDVLLDRNPEVLGSRLVIVEAAQTAGVYFPSNIEEYAPTPTRTHPRLAALPNDRLIISHACASAGLALAVGTSLIQSGRFDHALVLGATAPGFIEEAAFASAGALTDLDHCRPFDASADGTALGFFVGAVILGAAAPNRTDRLVISGIGVQTLGLGAQSDLDSQLWCMQSAARQAGVTPQFVSAHATGTKHGDRIELDAVAALGRSLDTELYVSSCKGEVGHSVHSAGLASAMVAFETLRGGRIFGTQHCLDPIEAVGAQVVAHGRTVENAGPKAGIVNSFGFGGTSCSILVQI